MSRRILLISIVLLLQFSICLPARAQGSIQLRNQSVIYRFNEFLNFEASFETDSPLIEGHIHFRTSGQQETHVNAASVHGNTISLELDLGDDYQPQTDSLISYWFVVANKDGNVFKTDTFVFTYADNRYQWRELVEGDYSVRWHTGDEGFAAAILSAARKGVSGAQNILPLKAPEQIEFIVYDQAEDVRLVLQLVGYSSVAGHSDPETRQVLLSLRPGNSLEIERQVPHEVAHLMLYEKLGAAAFARLPAWLNEGIAAETELYSDPMRDELLELANATQSLPTFISLCQAFPQDSSSNRLAYAQSASFVRYLRAEYGEVGFEALVEAYATSGDCLEAPVKVFGEDLSALESAWRLETFNPQSILGGMIALALWQEILISGVFVILIVIVIRRMSLWSN